MNKPRTTRLLALGAAAILVAAIALVLAVRSRDDATGRLTVRPNILLVSVDTLRADRVGPGLTPAIDGLAARGLSFTNARTVAPLTLPAHVSLMTGLFPPQHGVRVNGTYRFDGAHPPLARLLRDAGYQTAAFVGAYVLDRRFGLADGFDRYDDQIRRDASAVVRLEAERPADAVADRMIAWIAGAKRGQPFFAWIHFYDPHAPYTPPAEYLRRANGRPYDGEVAFADAQLARVLEVLGKAGHLADTIVVVVGDHGESLGEHGEPTHGMLVFEPAVRVPLVVAGPGVPTGVRRDAATLVDVAPTILGLLGTRAPNGLPGSDLLKRGRASTDVYTETEYPRVAGWSAACSLVEGRWKLIQSPANRLFDLETDPAEQRDVAPEHASMAAAMAARIGEIRAAARGGAGQSVPADVTARLRSLGYVASAALPQTASEAPDPSVVIGAWRDFDEAQAAIAARDYRRGLPLLEQLMRAHPESIVFTSSYVTALQESGNARAAVKVARAAVARHAGDAALFHALAVAAREAGDPDEAARAEQAVLALDADDPAAHNGLGLLAVDAGRAVEAVVAFERATALDPTNAQYWTNLGNAQRETGNRASAEQSFRRALEADPAAADAANGLGVLLVEAGRAADAIPWFERALNTAAQFYEARLNLGIACQQAGQLDRAAEAYRLVLNAPARFARQREGAARLLAALPNGAAR